MPRIRIRKRRCKKCGLCVEICPEGLFLQDEPRSVPRIPRQRGCIACGHCTSVCPGGAIVHRDFPQEELYENQG